MEHVNTNESSGTFQYVLRLWDLTRRKIFQMAHRQNTVQFSNGGCITYEAERGVMQKCVEAFSVFTATLDWSWQLVEESQFSVDTTSLLVCGAEDRTRATRMPVERATA
ncbi:uncharacterized protein LOC120890441 [Ictidomys tridecemlineatus]